MHPVKPDSSIEMQEGYFPIDDIVESDFNLFIMTQRMPLAIKDEMCSHEMPYRKRDWCLAICFNADF